jgi:hypothetical protein
MVKNDNQLYFFNDQYDDFTISNFLTRLNHKLYSTSLRQQDIIQDNGVYFGHMSEFKVDTDINRSYQFPSGTYTTIIKHSLIPLYREKAFIKKYGYNKPIALTTIIKDNKVFTKSPILGIDNYVLMVACLVINRDTITIAIKPTSADGISANLMNTYISNNSPWSISFNHKSDYYYGYKTRDILFTNNTISVNNFTDKVVYNKPDKTNNYDVYLSASSTEPNLLAHSYATTIVQNSVLYFQVDTAFKNTIYQTVQSIKAYVINNYRKNGSGKFIYDGSNIPIIKIPFETNPINVDNINVWKYDSIHGILQYRVSNNIDSYYPNVYDLRQMWDGSSSLYIEWYECNPTGVVFDNNFKDYIDCYDDTYALQMINKTAPSDILNYSPLSEFKYDYDDYKGSEYYGDIRAYKLSKLIGLLEDNPMRYIEFTKFLYNDIRKKSTFNLNITTSPLIYSRSVLSNANECDNDPSLLHTFVEAQSYIKLYNPETINRSVYIYIDGKRIPVTYSFNIGYVTYVYFAKRYITNQSKIILDVSRISDLDAQKSGNIYFTSINSSIKFPNNTAFNEISDADILYYHELDKEYIDNSIIAYTAEVDPFFITHENWRDIYPVMKEYLLTSNSEYFRPTDANLFVLKNTTVPIDGPARKFYKKISASRISIKPLQSVGVLKHIVATNCNIYISTYIDSIGSTTTILLDNFKGRSDQLRFRLFIDGVLLSPDQYTITLPETYDGTVTFNLLSYTWAEQDDLLIEYLPYDEDIIYDGDVTDTMFNNGAIFLDSVTQRPIDIRLCRVYLSGIRVPDSDIIPLGVNDGYKINGYVRGQRLTIYQQSMDPDSYAYTVSKTKMPINNVAKADSTFALYLQNK